MASISVARAGGRRHGSAWQAVLGALMAAGLACHSRSEPGSGPPDPATPVVLDVENHVQGDVVVYLQHGNQNIRLGTVTGLGTATFTFPWHQMGITGSSWLVARPFGGSRAYHSEPLVFQPGQSLKLTVESDLDRSSVAVW
jgi:hypothetical protein